MEPQREGHGAPALEPERTMAWLRSTVPMRDGNLAETGRDLRNGRAGCQEERSTPRCTCGAQMGSQRKSSN
eukprot:11160352-Lingulodinium_polyedra.AAC.1